METLLADNPSLTTNEGGKVCCSLTGHEMPAREDVVQQYVTGKRYLHARDQAKVAALLDEYREHLVRSTTPGKGAQLFCKLTYRSINRTAEHIDRHTGGKRFQRELLRYHDSVCNGVKHVPLSVAGRKQVHARVEREKEQQELEEGIKKITDDLSDLYPADDFSAGSSDMSDDDVPEVTASGGASGKRKAGEMLAKKDSSRVVRRKKPKAQKLTAK